MNKPLKITLFSLGGLAAVLLLIFLCLFFDVSNRTHMLFHLVFCRPDDYIKKEILLPKRGRIFDRDGNVLCQDRERIDIYMDCCVVEDSAKWVNESHALADGLSKLLPGRTSAEWYGYFKDARHKHNRYISIVEDIDWQKKDSLAKLPLFRDGQFGGGFIVEYRYPREYPYGTLARRTIGYYKGDNESNSFNKHVGLEGSYYNMLVGKPGERQVKFGFRRGKLRHWDVDYRDAQNGIDLHTTLDMRLQAEADSALRSAIYSEEDVASGCVVVMDVASGAIRAMVNLTRENGDSGANRLWESYNEAIAHCYEPGEALHTMTLASILRDGYIRSLEARIPTQHGVLPNMHQDLRVRFYELGNETDSISVINAFAMSSKYGMAYLATSFYDESHSYYAEGIRRFCLPKDLDFDLDGLRYVDITRPDRQSWQANTMALMANGYCLTMTPLDILSFYNTIANKGKMVKPYLVEKIAKGECVLFEHGPDPMIIRRDVLSPAICDTLIRALKEVTISGTGRRLKDVGCQIAGKTGTAKQIFRPDHANGEPQDPYHDDEGRCLTASTYVGFFPANSPKYSIICVLFTRPCLRTYYGGTYPAAVVRSVVERVVGEESGINC